MKLFFTYKILMSTDQIFSNFKLQQEKKTPDS